MKHIYVYVNQGVPQMCFGYPLNLVNLQYTY